MNNIINIGVLGCANIAIRSVIPTIISLSESYHLVGIASRYYKKAAKFANQFQTNAFEGYDTLLRSEEIQAVYIPLPNSLHAEWIEKAFQRDLHVLVEKSLACEYEDVVRLNEMAEKKRLALVENFQFRFHSQLDFILNLLAKGEIGELRSIRSSFGFPGLPSNDDIRYQKELGGGALLDVGAYPLKIAQIILGHDIEVSASNLNFILDKEVDIWGGAYLKQKAGNQFAEIAFGFDHFYQCSLELWGSKGIISTNRIFTANNKHEPVIVIEKTTGKKTVILPVDHHFKNMLLHFRQMILKENEQKAEYIQNNNQARLINELRNKANE